MIYCTLFNSNYLDRGLVMINSLTTVDEKAKIYVLCMDDLCHDILKMISISQVILIRLADFEDDQLLSVKEKRSRGEYCWTCTSKLIMYVINTFEERICTYVDADMRFYSNPNCLLTEMRENKCSVQVVPHRFPNNRRGKRRERLSGRNCVQFNTFTSEEKSLELLQKWINQCLEECSVESIGDQKYTDAWSDIEYVNVSNNGGAGMAPWNATRYIMSPQNSNYVIDRYTRIEYKMVFYHFQNLTFPRDDIAFVEPLLEYWKLDKKLINAIYTQYLNELYDIRLYLKEKYNFQPIIRTYITNENVTKRSILTKIKEFWALPIWEKAEKVDAKIRRRIRSKEMYYSFPMKD